MNPIAAAMNMNTAMNIIITPKSKPAAADIVMIQKKKRVFGL